MKPFADVLRDNPLVPAELTNLLREKLPQLYEIDLTKGKKKA